MSERPTFTVEYLEPVEAEPLPDEFSASRLRRSLLLLAGVVVVVGAAIVLLPGLGSLRSRFMGARPEWLALAAVLQLGSCAGYVLVFRGVFCRRMSWRTSTEIGLSELAANSVFSIGGAGGLALGAWILRRGGLSRSFIARRTVAFFLLTSLANVGFLALGGLALATGVLNGSPGLVFGLVPAVVAVAAIALALAARQLAGVLARRSMRARLAAAAAAAGDGVDEALQLLRAADPAIMAGAAGYLLFDVAMLGVCFAAFGNDVPPAGVLLVAYIVGQLGSLIPIPGGIGGVDAGLIGTLVLYGVDATDAAVAVIAYRGLLLAIPAVLGLPALAVVRRRAGRDARHRGLRTRRVGRGARPRPRAATEARPGPRGLNRSAPRLSRGVDASCGPSGSAHLPVRCRSPAAALRGYNESLRPSSARKSMEPRPHPPYAEWIRNIPLARYRMDLVQNLRPWRAAPPKLPDEPDDTPETPMPEPPPFSGDERQPTEAQGISET